MNFARDGFVALGKRLSDARRAPLAALFANEGAGGRLTDVVPPALDAVLGWRPLASHLRSIDPALRPIRIMLFSKNDRANWFVPWHQDAAVAIDGDAAPHGFVNPTVKRGVPHWEAPVALLERMVAVRVHVDRAGPDDGPLEIVPGSHKRGFIASDAVAATVAEGTHVCLAAPGDAHLLRPLLLHRSRRAATPSGRRTVQIELAPADALPEELTWRLRA